MRDSRSGPVRLLLLALVCGSGCGGRIDPRSEPGAMFVNLSRAEGIELAVEEDALLGAAARCAARWRRSSETPIEIVRADQARRTDWARVVMGSAASAEARELGRELGLIEEDAGDEKSSIRVLSRELSRPGDHVIACFEDPERAGLPVTLALANEPGALDATLDDLWPGARPALFVFRRSTLALEASLALDGTIRAATLVEHESDWSEHPDAWTEASARDGSLGGRVERAIPAARAEDYLSRAAQARARAASWTGTQAGSISFVLSASLDTCAPPGRAGVAHELARAVSYPPAIEALLAPGLPDDGGAEAAEFLCVAAWGEPAHEWMREGCGVDAAGTWWGRDLEEWCQALAMAERLPSADEIVADGACESASPHLVAPLRGLLFRALRGEHDAAGLRLAWIGEQVLDESELARLFRSCFPRVDIEARESMQARRTAHAARALDPSRSYFGVHLVAAADLGPAAHGSRAALSAIEDLAAQGAGTIAVESLAAADHGPWSGSAWDPPRRVGALEGDVGIAATLAAARERGLSTALFPALLTSPAGALAGDAVRALPSDAEEFFDDYERFVTHYALLAELCDVDLLAIGSTIEPATRVRAPSGTAKPGMEPIYAANHEGWQRVARRARQLFSGALTFSAASRAQVDAIDFWEMLDFTGIELFPSISARDRGPERLDEHLAAWIVKQGTEIAASAPKPWIVTRVGFRSTERAADGPISGGGAADPLVQERLYRGLASALESLRSSGGAPRGLLVFSWPIDASEAGPLDRGFGARGKPASAWLGSIFGR